MLRSLRLEEFVILAEAEIRFGPGLNAVTGETGTGKSILIDAIGFLAGGRGDADWIREGAGALSVEGLFDLAGLPGAADAARRLDATITDGTLSLRREMIRGGKSKAWVQGKSVRLSDLKEIGGQCLAIHGQGEHRRLLDPSIQLELLDRFAGAIPLREEYAAARTRWIAAMEEHDSAARRLADLSEKEEWHRFQLEEIDRGGVSPGEEEDLRGRRNTAAAGRRSAEVHADLVRLLFEDEGSSADRIETALHQMSGLGETWRAVREEVVAAREALRRARKILPSPDAMEEENLESIEERLALLARLKKKYGPTEEAILEKRSALAALLDETQESRGRIDTLAGGVVEAYAAALKAASLLSSSRRQAAPALGRAVTGELRELGMSGAILEMVLEAEESEDRSSLAVGGRTLRAFADGVDQGWFRLRPNPGEGAGPLASVASGGELSRTLLAILTVLGGREEPRTAIFDEVDAGVGGGTATAVARRLETLARDRQVLLVTHLPLIACRAARHFRVEKKERAGRTYAKVSLLDREERIGELARMLAGEGDSAIARKHAEALLTGASMSGKKG